jgi:putative peptidoglycan lipid II flippase
VPSVQSRRPEVSDGVETIVTRALAKRPDDRFADVAEMQSELEGELLALTRDDGSETAEVPLVVTALEVADPSATEDGPIVAEESPRPEGRAPRPRGSRRVWSIGLLVLVLAVGIGWAAYLGSSLGGSGEEKPTATTERSTATTTATTAAVGGQAIAGLTASSYDPQGDGGDGSEHPADAANVLDGDPATHWRTDTYRGTPDFNDSKPGVGLILTAPEAVAAATLHLTGGLGGWMGRVYTAPGASPPPSIEGWTPASAPFDARIVPMDVPLSGTESRQYLIWITRLAPTQSGTGYAASITEAKLETPS